MTPEEKPPALKLDQGKLRYDLIPPHLLRSVAKVLGLGAGKYEPWNWTNGNYYSRYYGALQRHLNAWYVGEEADPETGESHLAHAACNIAFLLEFERRMKLQQLNEAYDNRPKET